MYKALKLMYLRCITLVFVVVYFTFLRNFYLFQNDYLNPYTLTFKNPKTLQMFNIIVLYHYVMSFLVSILIFTFIFIFLSFFRTYFFFNFKPYFAPLPIKFTDIFSNSNFNNPVSSFLNWVRYNMLLQRKLSIPFYIKDVKRSLKDQVTHAPLLEFLWVIFPALILVAIAYPSIVMLYYNESYVDPTFTISVIGNQWYWTYEYNDFNLKRLFMNHVYSEKAYYSQLLDFFLNRLNEEIVQISGKNDHVKDLIAQKRAIISEIPNRITVDCNMIIAKDPKFLRLLTTDQCLVIPSKTPIRLLITSNDVIHSWAVPSYGIKMDAVPGRLNQQILNVPLVGTSWGQCSELCGVNHAYMPIEVKVLAFGDFIFFMKIRIREVLMPILVKFYSIKFGRLESIYQHVNWFLNDLKERKLLDRSASKLLFSYGGYIDLKPVDVSALKTGKASTNIDFIHSKFLNMLRNESFKK